MEVYVPKELSLRDALVKYYNANRRYIKESIAALKKAVDKHGIVDPASGLLIGWGYRYGDFEKLVPIFLDEESRKRYVLVFGAIGTGKTYLFMAMLHQDILMGKPVVAIDPKPSEETLNVAVYAAFESGREGDLRVTSMAFPSVSYTFAPLSRFFLPEELVSHLTAGIFVKDPFFIDVSVELTTVIVLIHYFKKLLAGEPMNLTFSDIIKYMVKKNVRQLSEEFTKEIQSEIKRSRPDLAGYLSALETLIELIEQSPQEYFSKVTTTLRVHLAQLSVGVAGKLLSNREGENFVTDIEAGDTPIVFLQLSGLMDAKLTKKISRVVASMMRTLAFRILAKKIRLKMPVSFLVDELANVVHIGFEEGVNKSREAGIQYAAFTQTVSNLYKEVGRDVTMDILGNFNTIVSLADFDEETARYVSSRLGMYRSYDLMYDLDRTTFRTQDVTAVDPGKIMSLAPRHFYIKDYRLLAYGKTADYYVPPLDVIMDVEPGIL